MGINRGHLFGRKGNGRVNDTKMQIRIADQR